MAYEMIGSVKLVTDLQTFASGATKRGLVITSEEKFPQDVCFDFWKDKCALLDSLNEGDRVKVHFDIRGNEYKGKYYVNFGGWKFEKMDADGSSTTLEPDSGASVDAVDTSGMDEDFPF